MILPLLCSLELFVFVLDYISAERSKKIGSAAPPVKQYLEKLKNTRRPGKECVIPFRKYKSRLYT